MTRLLDKYLEPYLSYLDQFSPVQPAVLLLKEMAKSGSLHDTVFRDMETVERQLFTVCHKYKIINHIFIIYYLISTDPDIYKSRFRYYLLHCKIII